MHYYSHHIDSYTSATRHLTPMEDLAYRRMLEVYYRDEGPLQGDAAAVARRVGLREFVESVAVVLAEFFTETEAGWRQERCEEELAHYRQVVERNRANGNLGGRPKKPTGFPVGSQSVASGNPLETQPQPTGNPPNPNPNPVPQPQYSSSNPLPSPWQNGGGSAPLEIGEGERGAAQERQAVFALLGATTLRSKAKNRRQIIDEIAGAVVSDGMSADQARRLIAKAKAETKGDYGALLGEWFQPVAWREKWGEILTGRVENLAAGIAHRSRKG